MCNGKESKYSLNEVINNRIQYKKQVCSFKRLMHIRGFSNELEEQQIFRYGEKMRITEEQAGTFGKF